MKTHLTALAMLAALLAITPSCSNEDEGTGDGDSASNGDGDSGSSSVIDADGDGVPDGLDTDGDGEADITGTAIDIDGDGTWDGLDTDGDGTSDISLPGGSVSGNPSGDGDGDGDNGDGDGDDCTDNTPGSANPDGMSVATDFEACAAEAMEAEALPADIVFMIDQSISMVDHTVPDNTPGAPTRWELLRNAILEFVNDEGSAGLRVGIQFFPQPGMAQLPDEGGNSGVSCDTADYSTLSVPVAELPGNAQAIEDAYPERPAGGFTPSLPALEGALTYARGWADMAENAGRGIAVVWVTDGFPTVCDDRTISGLSAMAESFNNPAGDETRVPTYVVGLGPTANLSVVAQAGGTGDGYFVANDECDAVQTLLTSLQRVANSPTLCEFNFPISADGSPLDPERVNVQFTPHGGATEAIRQTDGPSSCATTGGWYYDNPDDPETIHICPQSCGNFGGGTVEIIAGCKSITIF